MKTGRKYVSLILSVMLSVCLLFAGMPAVTAEAAKVMPVPAQTGPTYEDAGYYHMDTVTDEDGEYDLSELWADGIGFGMVLEDDGTGFIFFAGELDEVVWQDGVLEIDGETMEYSKEDGCLVLTENEEGGSMTMVFAPVDEAAPTREEAQAWTEEWESFLNGEEEEEIENLDTEEWWGNEGETYIVGDMDEFMEAIDDNNTVILLPGTYNISEWLSGYIFESWDWEKYNALSDSGETIEYGLYSEEVFDGEQIIIYNVDNLTIVSADPDDPAEIVCEPRYADVLTFIDCDNLTLNHIVMGHTEEEGYCSGDVLALNYCYTVEIEDCELYGCGAYAFELDNCWTVKIKDTDVHNCTYGCMVANNMSKLEITHSNFYDCQEFSMFEVADSDLTFIGCSFENLDGNMVAVRDDDISEVYFICCNLDKDAENSLNENGALDSKIFVY